MQIKDITRQDISAMLLSGDDYTLVGQLAALLTNILDLNTRLENNTLDNDMYVESINNLDMEI